MATDDDAVYTAYVIAYGRVRAGAGPTMGAVPIDADRIHLHIATAIGVTDAATATIMKSKSAVLAAVATALT